MADSKSVLIIGAGLGGLSAAISLRAAGYAVTVLEKNAHYGGKLNQLEAEGFRFDLGPSILTMPQVFENLFSRADRDFRDYVKIERIPLEWRSFFEDGERLDLYSDPETTVARNDLLTDEDVGGLKGYLAYGERVYGLVNDGYFKAGVDTMGDVIRHYGLIKAYRGFDVFSSMDDIVSGYIENPYLRDVLNFFVKYVGSSPYRAPAVLNLLPYIQHAFGLWYVSGGMYNLAHGIYRLAREIGVEFRFGETVTGAEIESGRLVSVRTDADASYTADLFVSNMEAIPFYEAVTGESEAFLAGYERFEPSCSGYVMHLGVDREYPDLAHHNFFFSGDPRAHFRTIFEDYKLPEDPTIYLVATTRTDSTSAPAGHENIKILPHIPYITDTPFTEAEYREFEERILDKLERMGLEGLRESTVYKDVWRPEDIRDAYLSNRGSIYGVVSDMDKNRGFKAPKRSDKYGNLYFVGGSVNPGGGMPMVCLSGQLVADMVLGQRDE